MESTGLATLSGGFVGRADAVWGAGGEQRAAAARRAVTDRCLAVLDVVGALKRLGAADAISRRRAVASARDRFRAEANAWGACQLDGVDK